MTKKHYDIIALQFATALQVAGYDPATYNGMTTDRADIVAILALMSRIANALQRDNPKFIRERFIAACKNVK